MMRPVRDGWQAQGAHYEYRVLTLGETANRNDTRRLLTDEAEYGRWELARRCSSLAGVARYGCDARSSTCRARS